MSEIAVKKNAYYEGRLYLKATCLKTLNSQSSSIAPFTFTFVLFQYKLLLKYELLQKCSTVLLCVNKLTEFVTKLHPDLGLNKKKNEQNEISATFLKSE